MCSGEQHRPGSCRLVLFWSTPITPWKGSELRNLTRRCFFCHAASPGKPAFPCRCNFSRHSADSLWGALPWDPLCEGWGSCTVSGSPELRRCSTWWHPAQRVLLPAMAAAPCRQGLRHLPAQTWHYPSLCLTLPLQPCLNMSQKSKGIAFWFAGSAGQPHHPPCESQFVAQPGLITIASYDHS